MGRRLRAHPTGRAVFAALWTALFAVGLYGLDRLFMGTIPIEGWIAVETIDDIPDEAGDVLVPAFLPSSLTWPPSQVRYRTGDNPGWWLGVREGLDGDEQLWYGEGTDPPPDVLGDLADCLDSRPNSECPAGWVSLSINQHGQVLYMLSRLDPVTTRRVLEGFLLRNEHNR